MILSKSDGFRLSNSCQMQLCRYLGNAFPGNVKWHFGSDVDRA